MSEKQRMKAVLLTGFGGFDKLEYREDIPVPQPAQGEVLIKVGACAINNTDLWTREGAYGGSVSEDSQSGWRGGKFQFPRIQGADTVGTIVALGTEVPASRLLERVIVNPTLYAGSGEEDLHLADLIGSERDGGFAEYVAVPAENAMPITSPLSDPELATFMASYLTAEHMLNRGRITQGDRVLITGASGGVGSALVQLVKRRGAEVIAIVGQGKESQVRAIGADAVIQRGSSLATALQNLGLDHIDAALDVVGGPQVSELLDALRAGGRFVTAGAIAGAVTEIDWRKIYLKHLDVLGSTLGTVQEANDLVGYIESAEIKPLLAQSYPLKEIVRAQQDFQAKKFFGKLVLIP